MTSFCIYTFSQYPLGYRALILAFILKQIRVYVWGRWRHRYSPIVLWVLILIATTLWCKDFLFSSWSGFQLAWGNAVSEFKWKLASCFDSGDKSYIWAIRSTYLLYGSPWFQYDKMGKTVHINMMRDLYDLRLYFPGSFSLPFCFWAVVIALLLLLFTRGYCGPYPINDLFLHMPAYKLNIIWIVHLQDVMRSYDSGF